MSSARGGGLHADPKGGGLAGGGSETRALIQDKAPVHAFPAVSDLWRESPPPRSQKPAAAGFCEHSPASGGNYLAYSFQLSVAMMHFPRTLVADAVMLVNILRAVAHHHFFLSA